LTQHLETLATQHPIAAFDDKLLGFLDALQQGQPTPTLTQLEDGKVDGLSTLETEELKARVRFTR